MTTRTLPLLTLSTLLACGTAPSGPAKGSPGSGPADTGSPDTGLPGEDLPDTGAPELPPELARRYADRGALAVGHTILATTAQGAALPVQAWYPTDATEPEAITYEVALQLSGFDGATVPFLGAAVRDGHPATALGPRPLVVLSHGFSLSPEWYLSLAEHLASHGFVVLAPVHAESDWAADILRATAQRPRAVSATIDLAESGVLEGIIDADSVAVLGHSAGGYTALAAAGARIDLASLDERCDGVSDEFVAAYFCTPFLEGEDELAAHVGLAEAPAGLWPSLGDPRVDAVVPMAGDAYLFGPLGLAEVDVPIMVLGGTADTGTPWDWGAGLTWPHVSSADRLLVGFEGGEHMLPVSSCETMPWIDALPAEYQGYFCADPAWDKSVAQELLHQLTTAFLLHALTGEDAATDALTPALYADTAGLVVLREQ